MTPFVADAGPLIALARIGQLTSLERMYDCGVVPRAVYCELAIGSDRPGASALGRAFNAGWLEVADVARTSLAVELAKAVDPGEAEAIALSLEQRPRFLLMDDAKGRAAAAHADIPVVGVAGVLIAAKVTGQVSAVGPLLDDLVDVGYRLSQRLLAEVRKRVDE